MSVLNLNYNLTKYCENKQLAIAISLKLFYFINKKKYKISL